MRRMAWGGAPIGPLPSTCYEFEARGVGGLAAPKSAELSLVSCPFGRRAALVPGAAVVAGAAAGVPSTKGFVVPLPQPTESTSVPSRSRRPSHAPLAARHNEKGWAAARVRDEPAP